MEKTEVLETVAPTKEEKDRFAAYIKKSLETEPNLVFGKPTVRKLFHFFLEEWKRADKLEAAEKKNAELRLVLRAAHECVMEGDSQVIEEGDALDCALLHDIADLYSSCRRAENFMRRTTLARAYAAELPLKVKDSHIEHLEDHLSHIMQDMYSNQSIGGQRKPAIPALPFPFDFIEQFIHDQRYLRARIADFTECVTALLWLQDVDASLGTWVTTLPPCGKDEYVNTTDAARKAVQVALASVCM